MQKILKLASLTLVLTLVQLQPAGAIPAQRLKEVEVIGQVSLKGKPLAKVPVEVRQDSCFGEVIAKATSNHQGQYQITKSDVVAGTVFYLTVPAGGQGQQAYGAYCLFDGATTSSERDVHTPTGEFYRTGQYVHNISLAKPRVVTAEEKACVKQAGIWGWLGKERLGCNLPYQDAGKLCTDAQECSSQVCFRYWKGRMQLQMESIRPNEPKQGACALDTFQVFNHRPGPLVGIVQQGKVLPFPVK